MKIKLSVSQVGNAHGDFGSFLALSAMAKQIDGHVFDCSPIPSDLKEVIAEWIGNEFEDYYVQGATAFDIRMESHLPVRLSLVIATRIRDIIRPDHKLGHIGITLTNAMYFVATPNGVTITSGYSAIDEVEEILSRFPTDLDFDAISIDDLNARGFSVVMTEDEVRLMIKQNDVHITKCYRVVL